MKLGAPPHDLSLRDCPLPHPVGMKGSAGDRLEARIAAAYTLRQFDEDCRSLGVERVSGRVARERKAIADILRELGGEPWPYSVRGDNSWVLS